ncbi:MAG: four helix bundle protein [bacterium]
MKLEKFEDLDVWQKSMDLSKRIYELTTEGEFSSDFELRNQIRKSSISIPSNIAEGFEREGDQEFLRFLSIAKGSAGEVRTQLLLAERIGYLSDEVTAKLESDVKEVSKLIVGLRNYLNQSEGDK